MAQLTVRNLDDELVRLLKMRAARSGRSAEAEHRALLAETLRERRGGRSFKELLLAIPGAGRAGGGPPPSERAAEEPDPARRMASAARARGRESERS